MFQGRVFSTLRWVFIVVCLVCVVGHASSPSADSAKSSAPFINAGNSANGENDTALSHDFSMEGSSYDTSSDAAVLLNDSGSASGLSASDAGLEDSPSLNDSSSRDDVTQTSAVPLAESSGDASAESLSDSNVDSVVDGNSSLSSDTSSKVVEADDSNSVETVVRVDSASSDEDDNDDAQFISAEDSSVSPTDNSSSAAPSTESPSTAAPSTEAPTTAAPSTEAPTTAAPSTEAPTTAAPTTAAPTTAAPSTAAPTTPTPSTAAPTTAPPSTHVPTIPTDSTDSGSNFFFLFALLILFGICIFAVRARVCRHCPFRTKPNSDMGPGSRMRAAGYANTGRQRYARMPTSETRQTPNRRYSFDVDDDEAVELADAGHAAPAHRAVPSMDEAVVVPIPSHAAEQRRGMVLGRRKQSDETHSKTATLIASRATGEHSPVRGDDAKVNTAVAEEWGWSDEEEGQV